MNRRHQPSYALFLAVLITTPTITGCAMHSDTATSLRIVSTDPTATPIIAYSTIEPRMTCLGVDVPTFRIDVELSSRYGSADGWLYDMLRWQWSVIERYVRTARDAVQPTVLRLRAALLTPERTGEHRDGNTASTAISAPVIAPADRPGPPRTMIDTASPVFTGVAVAFLTAIMCIPFLCSALAHHLTAPRDRRDAYSAAPQPSVVIT